MSVFMKTILGAALAASLATAVSAADHEVQMLNKGPDGVMVFEPPLTKIQPGDTVTFKPVDKGHNAETVKDMLPQGAEPFKGKMNETVTETFTVPGAYLIKCNPHFSMGMVALVVVGDSPANLDGIKSAKLPKKAHERLEAAISKM